MSSLGFYFYQVMFLNVSYFSAYYVWYNLYSTYESSFSHINAIKTIIRATLTKKSNQKSVISVTGQSIQDFAVFISKFTIKFAEDFVCVCV